MLSLFIGPRFTEHPFTNWHTQLHSFFFLHLFSFLPGLPIFPKIISWWLQSNYITIVTYGFEHCASVTILTDVIILDDGGLGFCSSRKLSLCRSFSTLNRHGSNQDIIIVTKWWRWCFQDFWSGNRVFCKSFQVLNGLARWVWPWVIYSNLYLKDFCSTE